MVPDVMVTEGYKLLADVGADVGDGLSTFHVDYDFEGVLSGPTVNEEQKSITFNIVSDGKSIDRNLMMMLPTGLIEGPFVIFVNGEKNLRFDYSPGEDVSTIEIELPDDATQMTIVGTKVVPEFGVWSAIILGIAFSSIILFQKSRMTLKF